MRIPRVLAGGCAVAGVWVLVGPGWALLAAAGLLWLVGSVPRLEAAAARARARVAGWGRWLVAGRQRVAAASMPLAVLGIAVGLGLAVGAGWGVAAASVAVGGLSLAADRAG